jgi:ABC-type Zn uptake system ZnuABC Zn-binding protein ZnuA
LHSSALSTVEIVVNPGASDINRAADSDEIALAGKGFNKQVEERFKQQNKKISFNLVDQMEGNTISEEAIQAFLLEGDLHPAEGEV